MLVFMGGAISCMKAKKEARVESKRKLAGLSDDYMANASFSIFQRFIASAEYENAKSIFIYISTPIEVDTKKILLKAISDGKTVSVPKIFGNTMVPVIVSENSEFEKNKFGILEPKRGEQTKSVDLCVVPLLAFSKIKARLGRGGGFYDKFLSDFNGKKIAIAFSSQEEDFVPTEENDVYMDMIITEKEIIK